MGLVVLSKRPLEQEGAGGYSVIRWLWCRRNNLDSSPGQLAFGKCLEFGFRLMSIER